MGEPTPTSSKSIPVHLTIRRLNVEGDWLLFARISSEGFIEVLCNDNELARKFYEDILASKRAPRDLLPPSIDYRWTNDTKMVDMYLANVAMGFHNFLGKVELGLEEDSPMLKELYTKYKRFLEEFFKERPKAEMCS